MKLTGATALSELLKQPVTVYQRDTGALPYVPLDGMAIAEPSQPEQCVNMLDALPPNLRDFYADEDAVLQGGGVDADRIAELRSLAGRVGGLPRRVPHLPESGRRGPFV